MITLVFFFTKSACLLFISSEKQVVLALSLNTTEVEKTFTNRVFTPSVSLKLTRIDIIFLLYTDGTENDKISYILFLLI